VESVTNKEEMIRKVREAGVVGAGGAGFPTHVKLQAEVELVLANGASCEPLLAGDPYLLERMPEEILAGVRAVMTCTGAVRGLVCVKSKHRRAVESVREAIDRLEIRDIALFELNDFYPAGDEHVLVHEVTGRTIPEAGLPLMVGVVVNNIESLLNIARALDGHAVTHRYLTVTGEVASPMVAKVLIGTPVSKVIEAAGGATVKDFQVMVGGPMMGDVATDLERPVTKTTSGIIVLPSDHHILRVKNRDPERVRNITRVACCQCTLCTELCPRFLLGHSLHPHKIMRGLNSPRVFEEEIMAEALLCSECGICEHFACPMMISPREVNAQIKRGLISRGKKWMPSEAPSHPSALRNTRYVPTGRLVERLNIQKYNVRPDFYDGELSVDLVRIPLKQHVGASAVAVVKEGDVVKQGDMVGEIPPDSLGATVHTGLDGIVCRVSGDHVLIKHNDTYSDTNKG
jgi:Na+-translocating ferredoxin:NAD+ oxidoreductase RnfC subunit